ncbi:ClC family H(+)/Cl(-) exchange transporter [uncultured Trichococcus sp.]|uniref:ClC family H(+)/Cl(-) exchange transporter n=1 Tax=uncultured Trichococcus sp. TaxID=189665 RepID=UPI002A188AE8|nr:ClC family H(+)/Cl(-) exchange transporter [uncultured Trichococcus sp.]
MADERVVYLAKGTLVGLSAGFIVSLFRLGIEFILETVIESYHYMQAQPIWLIPWVIFSVAAALIVGKLVKSEPNIKGSGIPQVEGQVQGIISLNWWPVLWKKFIGGLLAIGSGLFLGREGPSIQLGSAVGQGISSLTKGDDVEEKILLSSGAGAGLAAAFNAPLAGLMFVLEEVHHNFSPLLAITTFSSALVANFVSLNIFGLTSALDIGMMNTIPIAYYGLVIGLGVFLGLNGWLYTKVVLLLPKLYGRLPFIPARYNAILPFILVIPIGYFLPKAIGGGSELILHLSNWQLSLGMLIGLWVLRFVFSMISYGANVPGGIFLPILSLGAILGAIYGKAALALLSFDPQYLPHFIIFAMAGYFTAIGKAPLTAIILVTEMVGGMNQLMPLAICSFSAFVTADLLGVDPIYESLLEKLIASHDSKRNGKKYLFDLPIRAESHFSGKKIRDVRWPEDVLVTSIRRGQQNVVATGKTVMQTGDVLHVLTDLGLAKTVQEELKQLEKRRLFDT